MIHYLDGGPFDTVRVANGSACVVLAYDDEAKLFVYSYPGFNVSVGFVAGRLDARGFNPPPPIPAAARKPQIGEVWVADKYGSCLILDYSSLSDCWQVSKVPGHGVAWLSRQQLTRPATPAESEPFRSILDGLKRSLGES